MESGADKHQTASHQNKGKDLAVEDVTEDEKVIELLNNYQ